VANFRPGSPSTPSRSANSFKTRNIVVSDAPPPGPKISTCAVIASISLRHDAPAASAQAASVNARPRSRSGVKPALANAPDKPVVNPTRSANNRGNTIPACATVPAPPTSTDKPCDHPSAGSTPSPRLLVLFTSKVFLSRVLQI
jgi:hypothetical protein